MKSLRYLALSLCLALPMAPALADNTQSDCLMNYMELKYKDHLKSGSSSQTYDRFYFRQYSDNTFLGVDNSEQELIYVGPLSQNGLFKLGSLSEWLTRSECVTNGTPATTVTTSFYDFHYLQNVNGVPVASGSIIDKGANQVGSVTFGVNSTTAAFTPGLNGNGYSWGAPMSYGNGYGSNPKDRNVPAVAAICQRVNGTGGTNGKLTDVLVTKEATRLTSASQLANRKFTAYAEDCQLNTTESFSFDANGNATFNGYENNQPVSRAIDAGQFTSALGGQPIADGGEYTVFTAYSYVDSQSGRTRYVMVEHGSDKPAGLSRGYLGIWLEDNN